MKLPVALSAAFIYTCCAALEETNNLNVESPEIAPRAGSGTCSIGIGRMIGHVNWYVTLYSVPQAERQDVDIIATLKNAHMDKGDSITVNGPPDITITNVDNAPVFNYDIPVLKEPLNNPDTLTKVKLQFEIKDTNVKWDTDDCWASSVVYSGAWESWSCDFSCTLPHAKEL